MRSRLIACARKLFVANGYAETSTPEIVREAKVTRGALYHHFKDKQDLFCAVVTAEAEALAKSVEKEALAAGQDAMSAGSLAFFQAMSKPGRARLLLIDGPAVLGTQEMARIDAGGGRRTLRDGLSSAASGLEPAELDALADALSAAYDRAALAIAEGHDPDPYVRAMSRLIGSLKSG
ncbi:TetR/AcrR family transcriptional regulator [Ruegeria sediminis]|nr:TetR/AcrR family transcriptional regulator [Ruegeria sediminis]